MDCKTSTENSPGRLDISKCTVAHEMNNEPNLSLHIKGLMNNLYTYKTSCVKVRRKH